MQKVWTKFRALPLPIQLMVTLVIVAAVLSVVQRFR